MSAEPLPSPESSPFVAETEAEASLRRIAEAARGRKAKALEMVMAKSAYKAAKEAHAKALDEELAVIDAETTELPLFPRLKPGEPGANPAPPAPTGGDGDPRGATWLNTLGISPVILVKLGEAGIQTVSDLAAFTASGRQLTEIKGIGETSAELILDCLAKFWGDDPA